MFVKFIFYLVYSLLISFLKTWGAASNMRGGVKTKAKEVLSAMYGIPGTNKSSVQVASDVAWLLDDEEGKGRFKNGGLDVMVCFYLHLIIILTVCSRSVL